VRGRSRAIAPKCCEDVPVHDPDPVAAADTGRLLGALAMAAFTVDDQRRIELANEAAAELLGVPASELCGTPLVARLFAEPEQGAAEEVLSRVLGGQRWQGELQVLRPDGAPRAASISVAPLGDGERTTGALLVVEDAGSSRRRAQRLTDRLTRLARVTAELLRADDATEVTAIVTGHMADAAGATVASLSVLVAEDRLKLLGIHGGRAGAELRWQTFSLAGTPAGDCLTARRPLILIGRDEIQRRYPDIESAADGERSLVCLPLLVGDRPIGVATLSFPGRRDFDGAELDFFNVMSDTCAQALDRVQALADVADQSAKLAFLAEATEELASSLDYEATLTNVAALAVPQIADWCSIALGVDGELHTLAVAHVDPAKVALAREFQERYPPDPDAPRGTYQVFRTGQSELTPEITDEMLDASELDAEQVSLIRELNLRSAMAVPLVANNRVLGVITWVAGDQGRRFDESDIAFAEDLARRAAVAIDNAQLHTELREMALRLQRAVLPAALPQLPGWEVAAHYSPAGHLDAGGDFYDVIPLDGGRVAMFIGDVMGRGVHAAAAMAQMRASIRALVAVDPEPQAVLTRLDKVFEHYEMEQLVTMVYAVMDPARDEVTIANAGHPPPVRLSADGHAEQLTLTEDVLLGVGAVERSTVTHPFAPGDALLAFTDGLIERRNEDIDVGQRRLLAAVDRFGIPATQEALDALVGEVTDPQRDDDVAVLVVRRAART
jgi:PAS domain S-box-containing protein